MNKNTKPPSANRSGLGRKPALFSDLNGYGTRSNPPFDRTDSSDYNPPPPPPDEGYWAALLSESEILGGTPDMLSENDPIWDDLEEGYPLHEGAQMWIAEDTTLAPTQETPTVQEEDWVTAEQIFQQDRTVQLLAAGYNRGGLLVQWNSLRGFVPASQLLDALSQPEPQQRRAQLVARLNQQLTLRIIELDRSQNRLILSERAALVRPGTRAGVMDNLRRGDILSGRVTNLCDFGAFIDLGGLEGLVHISELSWGRVNHPRDILKRGQEIAVYVMDVHRDQGRIALSVKRLQPDPWATIEQRYQVGQMIEGLVTNIVDFGAFVCVEQGLEGLIHVSELAEGHFLHPRNVIQEGIMVRARVLNIDGRARRLGLSLRE
jgi:small subunit ribosomal protein S1